MRFWEIKQILKSSIQIKIGDIKVLENWTVFMKF